MRLFDKKFRVELYDVSVRASEMSRFQREIDENINRAGQDMNTNMDDGCLIVLDVDDEELRIHRRRLRDNSDPFCIK